MHEKSSKKIVGLLVSASLILAVVAGFFFKQDILDWYRLRGYQPSEEIQAIAKTTTMTERGKKIFYVAHPKVEERKEFTKHCNIEEFSIILGCYVNNLNIYIYDVEHKDLDGVEEVTAAHEMLHAAYARLSSNEREEVDALILDAYKNVKNTRIKKAVAQYRQQDPSSVPNELHSILGTEVRDLPSALERHYAKYFSNRAKVVGLSERYEAEFSRREDQVAAYDKQLANLKKIIESNQNQIDSSSKSLKQQKSDLDALKASNSIGEYNAGVAPYNSSVKAYNNLVEETQGLIVQYNQVVKQRNALAVEVQDLVEAIDSTPEKL